MHLYYDSLREAILLNTEEESFLGDIRSSLSKEESSFYETIQNEETARDWRIGRFLVKFLFSKMNHLLDHFHLPFLGDYGGSGTFLQYESHLFTKDLLLECKRIFPLLSICSRNHQNKGFPPILSSSDKRLTNLPVRSFSISHAGGMILVLFASGSGMRVGCDITPIGSITKGIINLFFHKEEKDLIRKFHGNADLPASMIWGTKEAVYKRVCNEESFNPLDFTVKCRSKTFECKSDFYALYEKKEYDIRIDRITKNFIVMN